MADEPEKDEKTEEATPRRRDEAREKGQVAFSTEMMAATMLVGAGLSIALAGGGLAQASGRLVTHSMTTLWELGPQEVDVAGMSAVLASAATRVIPAFLLVVVPILLVGAVVGYSQVGFRLTPKAISLDWTKLDPVKGLKRMFSARAAVRTLFSALKIVLVMAVFGIVAWVQIGEMSTTAGLSAGPVLLTTRRVIFSCLLAGILAIVALAIFDLFFQRHQHTRDLKMTKKELRDELKTTEGDPHVRSRIRQIQREMASRRMMADVPDATVVVTNPTHFAVALRYDEGSEGSAPTVVAKGVDEVAQRIKEVAREAGVLCYEDPPLARALHAQVEIGDEIPEGLFQAVAGVLAYVYRIQGRQVPA